MRLTQYAIVINMSKNLVIVESPAKAHTIEKYLGKDFKVLASVGHIRKDTKVDKSTFDVTYEIDSEHKTIVKELAEAVKEADKIWLATDEDREGEAHKMESSIRRCFQILQGSHHLGFQHLGARRRKSQEEVQV